MLEDEPSSSNQRDTDADVLDEKTKAQIGKSIESTMEEIAAKERSLLKGKEPLGHRYGEFGEPADDPYAYEEEMGQFLGNRHDKVPTMGSRTKVPKKLASSNERGEVPMNPSTETIVGPTTTAFTFDMREPAKCPETVKINNPPPYSSHTLRANSPILETKNPTHHQNYPTPPSRDRQQEIESTTLVDEVVEIDQNSSSLIMQGKEGGTSKVRKMEEIKGENRDEVFPPALFGDIPPCSKTQGS